MSKDSRTGFENAGSIVEGNAGVPPTMTAPALDLAKYRDLLGSDANGQAADLLPTLRDIMAAFVQNAWDVRIIPAFLPEIFADASADRSDAVEFTGEEE